MIVKSEILKTNCIYNSEKEEDSETPIILMLTETEDGERQVTFGSENSAITFSLRAIKELERRMDQNES